MLTYSTSLDIKRGNSEWSKIYVIFKNSLPFNFKKDLIMPLLKQFKMENIPFFLGALLYSSLSNAEAIAITCGDSNGYSYYFEGGAVDSKSAGFTEDGITDGKITLVVDEKGRGDVLALDATKQIKSAKAQGGEVVVLSGGNHVNWLILYPDGTVTILALHIGSMKLASYRNTAGNELVAKTSLMTSDCTIN